MLVSIRLKQIIFKTQTEGNNFNYIAFVWCLTGFEFVCDLKTSIVCN